MKKLLLTVCSVLVALSSSATFTNTNFYEENFVKMGSDAGQIAPKDGWLTEGNGLEPKGEIPQAFYQNEENGGWYNYILLNAGTACYAMANTCFGEGVAADQWLISPEIEVPYDNATLSFTAAAYCAMGQMPEGRNTFKVCVSEGGTDKGDFKQVMEHQVVSSRNTEIVTKNYAVAVNGYKGKKIRLAFVATGTNVGFTGFTNITLGQYMLQIRQNLSNEFVSEGEQMEVYYNFNIKTPLACSFLNGTLEMNGETINVQSDEKPAMGNAGTTPQTLQIDIPKLGTLKKGETMNYTLTLTPDFEGAEPSVITGTFICPEKSYLANVVVEELTATGCGYCPRGFGALQYYHEKYPGTETQGKAINIAVHSYMNHPDPMNEGVEEYCNKLSAITGTGLPAANFNRAVAGKDPSSKDAFEAQIAQVSYNEAKITKVEVPVLDIPDLWDVIGKEMTVTYNVKNAFNTLSRPLNASVILIEDNVQGFNANYEQTNYYYNMEASSVESWLRPYMLKYLPGGELGVHDIPASKMVYDHVARLCYPTFYGEKIAEEWTADEDQQFSFTFKVPANVMNIEETSVVVLVSDPNNYDHIVASDVMSYKDFMKVSEVNEIGVSPLNIVKDGETIKVTGENGTAVEVYALDGTLLGSYTVNGESLTIAPAWKGLVVVKASNAVEAKAAKVIL